MRRFYGHGHYLSALKKRTRSTVPLLDYWRDTDECLRQFGHAAGLDLSAATELHFEHSVAVRSGRGKPSFTDLMILSPESVVAVEAKYTEPRYASVRNWLGERAPIPTNREKVLKRVPSG